MKNRIVPVGLLVCILFGFASVARAQAPAKPLTAEAPVLPMYVEFRYVPQYFEQSVEGDSRYARIEALIDEGSCDVILLDKTMKREAFYSTSNRKVDAVTATGADAFTTAIDCGAILTDDFIPVFVIHFFDQYQQEVAWQFAPGEMIRHASPEVIARTDNSGITLLYAPYRAAGAAGTTLTIAGREYVPESTQPNDAPTAFYATDMTVGQILPGTDLWTVESSPADIVQTAKWDLSGDGRRQRILAVRQLSDTEAAIDQFDPNDPDAPEVVLNVVRVNDTNGLRSLSFETHGNTLWIFFGPVLPLPAQQTDDKTTVTFTVAENELANVASGKLEVQRAVDAEHLLWRFDTPNVARGASFETGVNLILTGGQATCANEDCSALSQKQP